MAGVASQTGDADSSRVPGLTSALQGSVNVHRCALLLVPQWQFIRSFVFYIQIISLLTIWRPFFTFADLLPQLHCISSFVFYSSVTVGPLPYEACITVSREKIEFSTNYFVPWCVVAVTFLIYSHVVFVRIQLLWLQGVNECTLWYFFLTQSCSASSFYISAILVYFAVWSLKRNSGSCNWHFQDLVGVSNVQLIYLRFHCVAGLKCLRG